MLAAHRRPEVAVEVAPVVLAALPVLPYYSGIRGLDVQRAVCCVGLALIEPENPQVARLKPKGGDIDRRPQHYRGLVVRAVEPTARVVEVGVRERDLEVKLDA